MTGVQTCALPISLADEVFEKMGEDNDTTRKKPFNFRKNDFIFFSDRTEAEEHLSMLNKKYGTTGLKIIEFKL